MRYINCGSSDVIKINVDWHYKQKSGDCFNQYNNCYRETWRCCSCRQTSNEWSCRSCQY